MFLTMDVYKAEENDLIKFRFLMLSDEHPPEWSFSAALRSSIDECHSPGKIFWRQVMMSCEEAELTHTFTPQEDKVTIFYEKLSGSAKKWYYQEVIYDLPAIPHLAILWLVCLVQFIANFKANYHSVFMQFKPDAPFTKLPRPPILRESPENYLVRLNKGDMVTHVFERLLALHPMLPNSEVLPHVHALYAFYQQKCTGKEAFHLSNCYRFDNVFTLFGKDMPDEVLNKSLHRIKERFLIQLMKRYLKEDKTSELTFLLSALEYSKKAQLLERCIKGKTQYVYHKTKWDFWLQAKFLLRQDNRVEIATTSNLCYRTRYAQGKKYHSIFEQKVEYMGNIMGLEFDEGNFHEGIICTSNSTAIFASEELLFFTQANFKKMLYVSNKETFFRKMLFDGYSKAGEFLFVCLPVEILLIILDEIKVYQEKCFEEWYKTKYFFQPAKNNLTQEKGSHFSLPHST